MKAMIHGKLQITEAYRKESMDRPSKSEGTHGMFGTTVNAEVLTRMEELTGEQADTALPIWKQR